MMLIQVVPKAGHDAYRLLRAKVLHEATTWYWSNKTRTRLRHIQSEGYIDVGNAAGVLTARVHPKNARDLFYLGEKFIGRVVAWFEEEITAINVQFVADPAPPRTKRR